MKWWHVIVCPTNASVTVPIDASVHWYNNAGFFHYVGPVSRHQALKGCEETLNCHEKQLKSSVKENVSNDKMVDLKLFSYANRI